MTSKNPKTKIRGREEEMGGRGKGEVLSASISASPMVQSELENNSFLKSFLRVEEKIVETPSTHMLQSFFPENIIF